MAEIAVFYMGKAGSSTVVNAAKALGIHASRAYDQLEPAQRDFPFILSLVREPVARNVSAFFEETAPTMALTGEQYGPPMVQEFLQAWKGHDRPLTWFSEQFLAETGVDVYAKPFDRKRGWTIFEAEPKRILVIRTDRLETQLLAALGALLGLELPPVTVERRNVGVSKYPHGVGQVYADFLAQAELPEAYLDRMLGSRYAKHFFYTKELALLAQRWSGAAKED